MSHDIQVISDPYITFYNIFELITNIRFSNNLLNIIGYGMSCCRRVFNPIWYLTINSECLW